MKIKKTLTAIALAATLGCTNNSAPGTVLNIDTYQETQDTYSVNDTVEEVNSDILPRDTTNDTSSVEDVISIICNDGETRQVECATTTPCKGYQLEECVDNDWEKKSDCEDFNKIAKGYAVDLFENKLAYASFENSPEYKIHLLDLETKVDQVIVSTVNNWPWGEFKGRYNIKIKGDYILYQHVDDEKINFKVINWKTKEIKKEIQDNYWCSDFDGKNVVCINEQGLNVYDINSNDLITIPVEDEAQIFNDIFEIQLKNDLIIFPRAISDDIKIYKSNNVDEIKTIPGREPLFDGKNLIYKKSSSDHPLSVSYQDLMIYNVQGGDLENLTKKLNGFTGNLSSHFTEFNGTNFIATISNSMDFSLVNIKSNQFYDFKVSEDFPLIPIGGTSISGKDLIISNMYNHEEFDFIPKDKQGIYHCELKDQWMK